MKRVLSRWAILMHHECRPGTVRPDRSSRCMSGIAQVEMTGEGTVTALPEGSVPVSTQR